MSDVLAERRAQMFPDAERRADRAHRRARRPAPDPRGRDPLRAGRRQRGHPRRPVGRARDRAARDSPARGPDHRAPRRRVHRRDERLSRGAASLVRGRDARGRRASSFSTRTALRRVSPGATPSSASSSCARSSCGAWGSWRRAAGDAIAHRLDALGGHAAAPGVPHAQRPPVRVRRRRAGRHACRRCSTASTSAVGDVPVVICRGERVLKNPTNEEVADCFGLNDDARRRRRCATWSSSAPARAGSPRPSTARPKGSTCSSWRANAPGGQAGTSSKIENYLGFPTGISGQALAGRAFAQAQKFGAEVADRAQRVDASTATADAATRSACRTARSCAPRTVIIASGVQYRRLRARQPRALRGRRRLLRRDRRSRRSSASGEEVDRRRRRQLGRPGGGLPGRRGRRHVHVLVRGDGPRRDDVALPDPAHRGEPEHHAAATHTEIAALEGDERLERVAWRGPDGPPRCARSGTCF